MTLAPRKRSCRSIKRPPRWHSLRWRSIEPLEPRRLLSNAPTPLPGGGYTPDQIRQVYGFNLITGLPGTYDTAGQGQTIAIIESFDEPTIRGDVEQFDQTFNIAGAPDDPSSTSFLQVVNQSGGSNLPLPSQGPISGSAATNLKLRGASTAAEVEWAHAMAPGANILLVEAETDLFGDLATAVEYAERQPNVSVVVASFGAESSAELQYDGIFTTPAGHQGITFVAPVGVNGAPTQYPAASPNVLAVGGTTLPADASSGNPDVSLETAFSLSTGVGFSQYEPEPSYQVGVVLDPTSARAVPDVAYDADPNTGFDVYNSALFPLSAWVEYGATDMGAAEWGALIAIADQERAQAGLDTLDGASQLIPELYLYQQLIDPQAFNDVTTGSTTGNPSYSAGPGYDLATGLGTPNAQYLVHDLAELQSQSPETVYWTGDAGPAGTDSHGNSIYNWDDPHNWSETNPKNANVPGNFVPRPGDNVVIDLDNQTIYKGPLVVGTNVVNNISTYDKINSLTVSGTNVVIQINSGTLDLSGGGAPGTLQADKPGDRIYLGGTLAYASVTSGTTISALVGGTGIVEGGVFNGTLNAPTGSSLELAGNWTNLATGTITAQPGSLLTLGDTWDAPENNPANPLGASGDTWVNTGTISATDATVELGGWLSYSDPSNLATLDLSTDTVYLIGTLDNSDGSLTLTAGQTSEDGSWQIVNGRIDGGEIDTTGAATFTISGSATNGTFDGVNVGSRAQVAIANGATALFEGQGWTNDGSIDASGGATLALYGSWTNLFSITVDASSTVNLGSPVNVSPTDPSAPSYYWTNQGTISIASGGAVNVGGVLTTDAFEALIAAIGAPAVALTGTLDNRAAVNPTSLGTLTPPSGSIVLNGGRIYQGVIVGANANPNEEIKASANAIDPFGQTLGGGTLDAVTLDDDLLMISIDHCFVDVINGLTFGDNAFIDLGASDVNATLYFGGFNDNVAQTVNGTGDIHFGEASILAGGEVEDLSNEPLTFGPNVALSGGNTFGNLTALYAGISNQGTLSWGTATDESSTGQLLVFPATGFFNSGTVVTVGPAGEIPQTQLIFHSDYTQTAGTTTVDNGAYFRAFDVYLNDGAVAVGNHGQILVANNGPGTGNYIQSAGTTTVAGTLQATNVVLNGGTVTVANGGNINLGTGNYSQSAGTTTVDGTLVATNLQIIGGSLNGTGTINARVSNGGAVYPGDDPGTLTVDADYTQTSTGTLDIEIGGPSEFSQLAVSGTATLAGTLDVSLINGFLPSPGQTFPFLTYSQLAGAFDTVNYPVVGTNEVLVPTFGSSGVTLTATPVNIYWTGDAGDNDWDNPGNWSYTDPAGASGKGPDGALPGPYSKVMVDLANQTINHAASDDDIITSLTVTAQNVTLNLTNGTLDLSGGGGKGTFQADQPGDVVNLTTDLINRQKGIVLRDALVTSGTTLTVSQVQGQGAPGYDATLDGVQLDGTLVTQSATTNNPISGISLLVLNDLVLNGTVELGPVAASGLPFGDVEKDYIQFGNSNDTTAESVSGTGTFQFGPNSQLISNDSNATFTIGPQITIHAGLETQIDAGGTFLDNQGTIKEDTPGGQLTISAANDWVNDGQIEASHGSTVTLEGTGTGAPVTISTPSGDKLLLPTSAWINSATGTLSATGATLDLNGVWVNEGTIAVDSTSTVALGSHSVTESISNSTSSPLSSWTNAGTLSIADGANVVLGDIFTTDFFNSFRAGLLTNGEHLAKDTVYLLGKLDDSAADNPVSGGALTLDASTGPFYLAGGSIAQGTVTTNGSDDLVATGTTSIFPLGGLSFSFLDSGLDGVVLDGTLDMTQYAGVQVYISDNLTLNGTIELGGAAGTGNFATLFFSSANTNGSVTPETLSGTGTVAFGQDKQSDVLNGDLVALTLGPNVTIQGGLNSQIVCNGLDNQGAIKEDSPDGQLMINGFQWTNDGSIEVSNGATVALLDRVSGSNSAAGRMTATGATLNLGDGLALDVGANLGPWTNAGTITAADSTLNLQGPLNVTLSDQQVAGARWSNTGTITVSGASTVNLGGVFTTDTLNSLFTSGPVDGTLNLTGTLDNSPADNSASGGNLVLNSSSGPLNLAGGRIYQGTIATTAGDDLLATSADETYFTPYQTSNEASFGQGGGVLDGVTLDGTLDMTQFVYANVNVINGLTLNGTIELGGAAGTDHFAYLYFGMGLELVGGGPVPDTTPETIDGTGTIVFGQDNVAATSVSASVPNFIENDAIYDTIAAKLTIGPKITIEGGFASDVLADGVGNADDIENQGTIVEKTSGGVLTLAMPNGFANAGNVTVGSGGTLATVAFIYGMPGAITVGSGSDYTQSDGSTAVDGTLTAANFSLTGGTLSGTGAVGADVMIAASLDPGDATGTLTVQGNYTQMAAGILNIEIGGGSQYSQLVVTGTATLDGTLNVSQLNGFTPAIGDAFKVLTFASSSGKFGTANGLNLGGGDSFVPTYDPADLTLTVAGQQLGDTVGVTSDQTAGSVYGQKVTFTATVAASDESGNTPAGSVQFQIDGGNYGQGVDLSDGAATISTESLPAGNHTVTALYSGNAQFQANSGTLKGGQSVAPALLTITANDQSMLAGGSVPTLTASYVGLVNGDTSASLTKLPVLSTTATSDSPPGNYPITAKGAVDPNYTISYEPGTLTVSASTTSGGGIAATAVAVTGYEHSTLTALTVATFTDAQSGNSQLPAGDFSATINWGDGASSAGSIALAGGTFTVGGSHTYADEHVYPISVAISGDGLSATVTTQATILEELLPNGTRGTANQRFVMEIYRDVLDRAVDQGGLTYWTAKLDAGVSREQVAYGIVQTAFPEEYERDTVQALYATYLHRAPDPGGLQSWTAFLYDGGTDEELAQILVSSPEYLQSRGGGTNDGFLDALYQDALGRPVDASGRAFYDTAMAKGATPASMAAIIFGSDEYRRDLVSGLYEQLLDRPPDPQGLDAFVGQLAAGQRDEQIIAEMVSSDEFFAKTAE